MPGSITTLQKQYLLLSVAYILVAWFISPHYLRELHEHWTTPADLDFGYLLLLITLYFGFKNSRQSSAEPTTNRQRMLLNSGLLLTGTGLAVGVYLDIKSVVLLLMVLGWPLFMAAVLGYSYGKKLLLPTLVLLMGLPLWYLLIPPLQSLTSLANAWGVGLLGIPAYINGNYITVPNGTVHIARGCSGLKYFLSALALNFVLLNLAPRRFRYQLLITLAAALLACIANWIRVFILTLVAHYISIDHPLMKSHDNLGWVVFALVTVLPLIVLDRKLPHSDDATTAPHNTSPMPTLHLLPYLGVSLGLLLIPVITIDVIRSRAPEQIEALPLPARVDNWILLSKAKRVWLPDFQNPDIAQHPVYKRWGKTIEVSLLSYGNTEPGKELGSSVNTLYDEEQWKIISSVALSDQKAKRLDAKRQNGQRYTSLYWYQMGAERSTSALALKIKSLGQLLNPQPSLLYAFTTRCQTDCEAEAAELVSFSNTFRQSISSLNAKQP